MDLRVPLWQRLADSLVERRANGLYREPVEFRSHAGRLLVSPAGETLIHFGSNDYLGLCWHPELKLALQTTWSAEPPPAPQEDRYGAGASPLLAGHSATHEDLRRVVANLENTEDSILFSSGFAANLGAISGLAGPADAIFSDELNHASLIDGCRLSKAKVFIYQHNDCDHLEELIARHRKDYAQAFVATDSLFSMDGDIADLPRIEQLADRHDLIGIVDEAHATGVYGQRGGGLLSEMNCQSERWVKVGTFSKAIGCAGGFVAANRTVIEWLHNFARPYIYSTAMPVLHCNAARRSIELLREMDTERLNLRSRARQLRADLRALGHRVGGEDSPILALYGPDVPTVLAWAQNLRRSGIYAPAIRPPTVPADRPMLRISLSASHLPEDFERLLQACRF